MNTVRYINPQNRYIELAIAGLLTLTALAWSPQSLAADLPAGVEIAKQINARDEGEAVARALLMRMTDKRGKQRVRETFSFRKYYGDEKRTVIFYKSPKNIKDTAFLTYDYPEADRDDDQWLYLPAARKVRRISASDRGDYFLGTDFTYEDIKKETKVGLDDYRWTTIGEETVDGHACYVVEAVPVDPATAKDLGYGKVMSRVDKAIWMVRKAEYWDVAGNRLKTTQFSDIRPVQEIWTAHQYAVENHKTGHKTSFEFSAINYAEGVNDAVFTQGTLRRGM